ncbi:MAG: DUF454 domain-containing protein [Acidobacteria bacterium]|nr:DUF454 domain-containing protein [Acidobacteriota bacterium]
MSMLHRPLYITLGFFFVALGVIGIPTPLLPTTPFLLLAAYFFARSSQRWHDWLMGHSVLSPYIKAFRRREGLTKGQKLRIGLAGSLTLFVTAAFSPLWQARALAAFIWSTGMLALIISRTARPAAEAEPDSSTIDATNG